jgi:hypothetical protein
MAPVEHRSSRRPETGVDRERRRLRAHTWAVTILALLTGVVAAVWVQLHNATLAYSDAEAHLNVAKRVVSGLVPGASQLGGGWLPLQHVLMLPLVGSDSLWRSGIAGVAVSVPALALLAAAMYRIAHLLTGSRWASWLAPLVVLANLNVAYLAATPMPDLLALALAATSIYFLATWVLRDGLTGLVLAALFAALATLTRYDSWVLIALEAVVVLGVGGRRLRETRGLDGVALVFGCVALFGIASWVAWNQLIFGNAGYFVFGSGSSWWGLRPLVDRGQLPAYLHLGRAVGAYLSDTALVAGSAVLVAAGVGAVFAVRRAMKSGQGSRLAVLLVCLFPLVAYPLGLWAGFARLAVPAGGTHDWSQLANARFGVAMLLPLGLLVATLAARHRLLVPALAVVVALSAAVQGWTSSVVTYEDALHGHASRAVALGPDAPEAEQWLADHYTGGRVLMDTSHPAVSLTATRLPMRSFIQVGDAPYWAESMDRPQRWARRVLLREEPQDALWTGLTDVGRASLADDFVEVHRSGGVRIFERRPAASGVVRQRGTHLYLGDNRFLPVGVNSYDLLQLSPLAARARLEQLSASRFNVVRVWCFDHDGGLSPQTLQRLDAVVADAHSLGLRMICTLGNALPDYGGPSYFTPAGQDFFTSDAAMSAYEAQVQLLLDHEDAAGNRLADSPTILAWDLLNEPRLRAGEPRGAVVAWTERMARFVNSLDQNHLITIGGEGFTGSYPADRSLVSLPGTGFTALCGAPGITLCSAHLYPKYLADPGDQRALAKVLTAWRDAADSLRRPVVLEGTGYPLPGHSPPQRTAFLRSVAQQTVRADLDGALLWNVGASVDQGYRLSYSAPAARAVLDGWAHWLTPQN